MRAGRTARPLAALVAAIFLLGACDDDDGPSGPGAFPDVRGLWIGQYSVTDCVLVEAGDPFFCSEAFYEGIALVFEVTLQQSGPELSGTADQGLFTGQVAGSVDQAGLIELTGRIGVGDDVTTRILSWDTQLVGDSIVGSWRFRVEDNTGSGFATARIDAAILLVDPDFVLTFFNCPVEASLALTDEVGGSLVPGDCQLAEETGQSYMDVFALDLQAEDSLTIDMISPDFDPFLWIADVNEQTLGFDGELGRDSVGVLGVAGRAETWLVIANSLTVDQVGDYVLRTEEQLAPATPLAEPLRLLIPADGVLMGADRARRHYESRSPQERIRYKVARPVPGKRGVSPPSASREPSR